MGLAALAALVSACAGSTTGGSGDLPNLGRLDAEPSLRIGLRTGISQVEIGATSATRMTTGRGATSLRAGDRVVLEAGRDGIQWGPGSNGGASSAFVDDPGPSHFLIVDGVPYRGAIEVVHDGDRLRIVNEIGLEDYLVGVVRAEMGRREDGEFAALQAQAVASRTFALQRARRAPEDGVHLVASVADQAYRGADGEDELVRQAVASTRGQLLTFRGQLIPAFFHSTCGFRTASPEEAFGTVRPQPYLAPVSDERPGGGYFCDGSPRFRWSETWSQDELREVLRGTLPSIGIDPDVVDRVGDVTIPRSGPSGRAAELRIQVGGGSVPIFSHDLRRVLRTPDGSNLGSTAIRLAVERDHDRLTALRVDGAGWGHGVGMCQWGAIGRARAGQGYETILTTYYSGVRIERWY